MNKKQIKDLALSKGFKLKEQPSGEMDLNPYVYEFAEALLAKANERIAESEQNQLPVENGENRYGLDVSYFRNAINRELNKSLENHKPDELARVLARLSRTADESVMFEPEFSNKFAIEKHDEGVDACIAELTRCYRVALDESNDIDDANSIEVLIDHLQQLRKEQE